VGPGERHNPKAMSHRTVQRVTRILEEVVYSPGIHFAGLARAVDAPKSSMHGFIQGLLAEGWLHEVEHKYYLGPAVYGLTMASGHVRAGLVTQADLHALHEETGVAVFLGVSAGDHLIYVADAGTDSISGFAARTNIRRTLLMTAGGKALLAALPEAECDAYLRRHTPEESEQVQAFCADYHQIRSSRIATNTLNHGRRYAVATPIRNHFGSAVGSVTLVGATKDLQPRSQDLEQVLLQHVDSWRDRALSPREAI
jgi:DNA-binding IclR family transcriptional regulator